LWQGALHKDPEFLLLIKTAARRCDDIDAAIPENHRYEVPEILPLPIQQGLPAQLE
jgi:periplasmic divalent cation tolerance protein